VISLTPEPGAPERESDAENETKHDPQYNPWQAGFRRDRSCDGLFLLVAAIFDHGVISVH